MTATAFDTEMDGVLLELLTEFGWSATLTRTGEGTLNRDTLDVVHTPQSETVRAVFFDPTTSSLSGYEKELPKDYIVSRKWLLIRPGQLGVETGDKLVGTPQGDLIVDKATAVGPNVPIYWKVAAE